MLMPLLVGVLFAGLFLLASIVVDGKPQGWRMWLFTLGLSGVCGLVAGFLWPLVVVLIVAGILFLSVATAGLSALLHGTFTKRENRAYPSPPK